MPVIWPIKPCVEDTIWSTDIRSPGFVAVLSSFQCFCCLLLHCLRFDFAKRHFLQVSMLQFARRLGMMFCFAIVFNLTNKMWPKRWWYQSNSEAAMVGCLHYSSYITTGLGELAVPFKLKSVAVGWWMYWLASSSACWWPMGSPVRRDQKIIFDCFGGWASSSSSITTDV